jgi:hypothetical protein
MTLVGVRIGIALEVGKAQSRPIGEAPQLVLLVELGAQRRVELARALDGLDQLGTLPAHHQADRVLAVLGSMGCEIPQHAVCLAPAPSAAEEDLEDRTAQQGPLRACLGLPDDLYCTVVSCAHWSTVAAGSGIRIT